MPENDATRNCNMLHETTPMKSIIYKALRGTYRILPFKRMICLLLKKSKIPNNKFYKDFHFNGQFKVSGKNTFELWHHGGSIENETFWKGLFVSWEKDTGWIWQELCVFSDTILDIGANTGIYSMVAKSINAKANVFAFEPSIHTYKKLQQNNDLNKFDVKCEQIALSNTNGEQVFFDSHDSNQTSASLSADMYKNRPEYNVDIYEYSVKTMTIADYIENNKISKIDLIKLDIEMHEPAAIEGLGKYLLEHKPIVVIEVLSEKVAEQLNQLIDNKEHVIFHLEDTNKAQLVEKFSYKPPLWNFLFFHKDLTEKIKEHTTLYNSL